jgi:hypothetical protein
MLFADQDPLAAPNSPIQNTEHDVNSGGWRFIHKLSDERDRPKMPIIVEGRQPTKISTLLNALIDRRSPIAYFKYREIRCSRLIRRVARL